MSPATRTSIHRPPEPLPQPTLTELFFFTLRRATIALIGDKDVTGICERRSS